MPNPLTLDAGVQPPVGVANPSRIEFYIGNPPRRMLIFSGVAVTNWRNEEEDDVAWEDVVVKLGDTTTQQFSYTSTVGLASLSCDDSDFNFFADKSTVVQNPQTAELELHVPIGVSGEPASLNRFSYHVQILSDPVIGSIMGTIRWAGFFGSPSQSVLDGATSMFTVEGGVMVETTQPGDMFRSFRWDAKASTQTSVIPRNFNGTWAVPYKIDNVPLGVQLEVRPDPPGPNFVSAQPAGYQPIPEFNPPLRIVDLTPAAPSAVGVDFDMLLVGAVK